MPKDCLLLAGALLLTSPLLGQDAAPNAEASASAPAPALPPHPTLLYAEHTGQRHLVIAVDKDHPVAEIGGKRTPLPAAAPLITERAALYGAGPAEISPVRILSEFPFVLSPALAGGIERNQTRMTRYDAAVIVTAAANLPDCYLLITACRAADLEKPEMTAAGQVFIRPVGNLEAGKPVEVKFNLEVAGGVVAPNPRGELRGESETKEQPRSKAATPFFCQLMSRGQEVQAALDPLAARFYLHRERAIHVAAVETWSKRGGASRPVQPFLQIPPLLAGTSGLTADTAVAIEISAEGLVTNLELDPGVPADTAAVLDRTFRAWLFLPRIKDGVAVPARVKIPLKH